MMQDATFIGYYDGHFLNNFLTFSRPNANQFINEIIGRWFNNVCV